MISTSLMLKWGSWFEITGVIINCHLWEVVRQLMPRTHPSYNAPAHYNKYKKKIKKGKEGLVFMESHMPHLPICYPPHILTKYLPHTLASHFSTSHFALFYFLFTQHSSFILPHSPIGTHTLPPPPPSFFQQGLLENSLGNR